MNKDFLFTLVGAVAVLAVVFGLASAHGPYQEPLPAAKTAVAASPVVEPAGSSGNVIMRVNDEPITEREFALFISTMPEQMQPVLASGPGRRQAAEQLVRLKVLEQEGRRLGADSDPEVAARMKFGHTNVAVEYALSKLATKTTDADLQKEYNAQRSKFEVVDLSHILIGYQGSKVPPRGGRPLSLDDAFLRAKSIVATLRQGTDFGQVARAASDDTASAAQGGRLGPIPIGNLPQEIEAAVSRLQPGQVSDPVRTEFGIHIFKLNGRQAQTLEQVKPMLQERARQTAMKAVVDRLQKEARVELDPKFFHAQSPDPDAPPVSAPKRP